MIRKALGGALVILLALPPAAWALGLGDIRLASSLNAPITAEIELLGATPEELSSLKATLASRETFTRYGLDYPALLNSITVTRGRSADGRDVLAVRSTEAATEPFLTLLVEVNWARGRLVREYTVLLDPPVYAANATAAQAPPVAAPVESAPRSGPVERPAPAPAANASQQAAEMPAAAPRTSAGAGAAGGETYQVRPGDSLSRIVRGVAKDPATARRTMVAIYRANPKAFEGNMNLLRSGEVLRMPDDAQVAAVSAGEALAQVRQDQSAWRGHAAAGTSSGGGAASRARLRLVPPTEGAASAGASAAATPGVGADTAALKGRVKDLESQLAESKRLLDLRNAELANLQAKLGGGKAPAVQPPPAAAAPQPPATAPPAAATTPPATTAQPETAPAPAPAAAPEVSAPPVAAAKPVRPPEAAKPEGSWVDTLKDFWYVPLLLVIGGVGLFLYRKFQERQRTQFDDQLGRLAADTGTHSDLREFGADTATMAQPIRRKHDEAFVVEESGAHRQPTFAESGAPAAARAPRNVVSEDTISSETAINLDQGDPLAEADFHMAYGLYDQAADLVRMAIAREPERRDLKLKLLEVFFVWGNKEQFLATARELAASRAQASPGEWEKIVIMGRQLAPDDALFGQSAMVSGAAAAGVDLDLEGGQNRIDFDLLGEPGGERPSGVDFELSSALSEKEPSSEATTGEAQQGASEGLDFVLDDPARGGDRSGGTTREMTHQITAEMSGLLEEPPTGTFEAPQASGDGEAPTVEQPAMNTGDNPTVRRKVERALRQNQPADQTAELALDDLGLDLGGLDDATGDVEPAQDAPTMVAGLDANSRRVMAEAERRTSAGSPQKDLTASGTWLIDERDAEGPLDFSMSHDAAATAQMMALDASSAESTPDSSRTSQMAALKVDDLDLDLGHLDDTAATRSSGAALDLDVGTSAPANDGTYIATQQVSAEDLALPDLEPVTMSEVGTKLDLARAYMDMGDPEGARNILQEVLQEGSVSQKQEAQRLISSLPG